MLHGLFASKSVEKILLFLLINEQCYATQLHRILETPLTPIQKALSRLERERVVKSQYVGKMRLYQLNNSYPLFDELQALLKKAYALLGPKERKQFYYIRNLETSQEKAKQVLLLDLWKSLKEVSCVSLSFQSERTVDGKGEGDVEVDYDGDATIIFKERGQWQNLDGNEVSFWNSFRWTLSRVDCMISLEHLHMGAANPVFLFSLIPSGRHHFESIAPHDCGEDTYLGHLHIEKGVIELVWRIIGPRKNDEIHYIYS